LQLKDVAKKKKKKERKEKKETDIAELVQFSLQVRSSWSPKECGVDLIRGNCLHGESS
jgi:hypothetical protein